MKMKNEKFVYNIKGEGVVLVQSANQKVSTGVLSTVQVYCPLYMCTVHSTGVQSTVQVYCPVHSTDVQQLKFVCFAIKLSKSKFCI